MAGLCMEDARTTGPAYVAWDQHLDHSEEAKAFTRRLNDALARVVGKDVLFSVVSDLTDVDYPLVSADVALVNGGQKLYEAIETCYSEALPQDCAVVLIHPEQMKLNLLAQQGDTGELEFWDTVLYYLATAYSLVQNHALRYSRYLSALVVFAEALPIPREERKLVRDGAIECFLNFLLEKEVDLEDISLEECASLDAIQPGIGALLRAFSDGVVSPPHIEEVQRSMGVLIQATNNLHLLGTMVKMDPAGRA